MTSIKAFFAYLNPAARGALISTVSLFSAMILYAGILHKTASYWGNIVKVNLLIDSLLQRAPATLAAGLLAVLLAQFLVHNEK